MKKAFMFLSALTILISVLSGCNQMKKQPTQHENVDLTDTEIAAVVLPDDFAFSITWDCYGISSYDSKTGKLVKTNDTDNIDKYTDYVLMSENELKTVYKWLFVDIDLSAYPKSYDPFNDPDSSINVITSPVQTLIISATANGVSKTVTCDSVAIGDVDDGYNDAAKAFLTAHQNIVAMITGFPEWQALPEYEFYYC